MAKKSYLRIIKVYIKLYFRNLEIKYKAIDSSKMKTFIICFTISFFLWLFNYLNEKHTATFDLPISIVTTNDTSHKLISVEKPPSSIRVNISGHGWSLLKYIFFPGKSLDLHLKKPTEQSSIKVKNLLPQISKLFNDIKVNYVLEDNIVFKYDTLTQKKVEIRIDSAHIALSKNYRIVSTINYYPKSFILKSPSGFINDYPDTLFITISEKGIQKSFNKNFKIDYPFTNKFNTINYKSVGVHFEVQAFDVHASLLIPKIKNFPRSAVLDTQNVMAHVHYLLPRNRNLPSKQYVDTIEVELDFKKMNKIDNTICPDYAFLDSLREAKVFPKCFNIITK